MGENNKRKEFYRKKYCQGITLITLIITIIIALILISVSIQFITRDEMFQDAQNVVEKSEEHIEEHQQMVNDVRNLYK